MKKGLQYLKEQMAKEKGLDPSDPNNYNKVDTDPEKPMCALTKLFPAWKKIEQNSSV